MVNSATSSDANISSGQGASCRGVLRSPDLSLECLLKHITDIDAEESQQAQKMFNEALAKFESRLDEKVEDNVKCTDTVAAAANSLAAH